MSLERHVSTSLHCEDVFPMLSWAISQPIGWCSSGMPHWNPCSDAMLYLYEWLEVGLGSQLIGVPSFIWWPGYWAMPLIHWCCWLDNVESQRFAVSFPPNPWFTDIKKCLFFFVKCGHFHELHPPKNDPPSKFPDLQVPLRSINGHFRNLNWSYLPYTVYIYISL